MNEEQTWLTKRIVLIVVCLICLIQLANAYTITTFTDGTTSGNLTYTTGTEWYNKALNIPNGKTATNAYIYLTGYLGIPKQSFNNDGNNETTYSGLWDIKSGNLYNPERTNDLDINTYARTDSPPAVLGSYRINFTLNSTHTADINITVRILTDSLTGNIIYCKNLSNNNWVQLSDISSKTDIRNMIVQASQSCFINSSLLQLNISVAGVYSQIYEVWINSSYQQYPTNSTIILNNNTVIFNYGNTNGTELNHTVLANFTTYLSGVVGYPQNFSFRSNTSGILEYSGLYVSYASTINITFFDEDTLVSLSGQNLTLKIC